MDKHVSLDIIQDIALTNSFFAAEFFSHSTGQALHDPACD